VAKQYPKRGVLRFRAVCVALPVRLYQKDVDNFHPLAHNTYIATGQEPRMYEKYVDALKLMDATIAANKDEDRKGVSEKWDELYTFIHANFIVPDSAKGGFEFKAEYDLCRPLIDGTFAAPSAELEEQIRKIPPVILEVVWPVAIARYLLRDVRIVWDHRKSSTFTEFHHRYGNMILNC
jgi:hypothetical protein